MFEWDEAKRERTIAERELDFLDAVRLFDGRPVIDVAARTETEARTLTTGQLDDGKFYTVVWTWRGEARRIISFEAGRAMTRNDDTTRLTRLSAEDAERLAEAGSRTNWARQAALTPEEIEAQAAADEAEDGMVVDWSQVTSNRPAPKAVLNMRVDRDVLEFFRAEGRGYQTKINAVLRAYKDAQTRRG